MRFTVALAAVLLMPGLAAADGPPEFDAVLCADRTTGATRLIVAILAEDGSRTTSGGATIRSQRNDVHWTVEEPLLMTGSQAAWIEDGVLMAGECRVAGSDIAAILAAWAARDPEEFGAVAAGQAASAALDALRAERDRSLFALEAARETEAVAAAAMNDLERLKEDNARLVQRICALDPTAVYSACTDR